jgi:multidrug efflux pump subunit AcrA (membrane-fusion protein)
LLALAAASIGCGTGPATAASAAPAPIVSTVQPRRGDLVRTITLPGDLVGIFEAALHAKVTGYLQQIDVDKGDWVKKGQLLATIEVPELRQKLKRAKANLEVRRVTYQRLRSVWQSDPRLVAREDVDVAHGQFAQAQADVEELEALVSYTRLLAPFDGVVTARNVDPGDLIRAGGHGGDGAAEAGTASSAATAPVLTVADIDTLRVYVYVPEEETGQIRRGLPATLRLQEFPGREFHGTVTRYATALDLSTRTMLTEVDIPNPTHELYPGMYADVRLELERHARALQLPVSAVGRDGERAFVFVVRHGRLKQSPVKVGLSNGDWVEIASGLKGQEHVVRTATPTLSDGEVVQVRAEKDPGPDLAMAR